MKTSSSTIWMDCITSPAVPGLSIGVMRCTQSEGINGVRELVWRFELGSVQREQRGSIEAPSSRRRHFDGVLRHSKRAKDTHPRILGARDAQPGPGRNLRQSRTQRRLPFERKILTRPRRVERRHQSSPVSTQHYRYIHYHALSTQSWWFWTQLIGNRVSVVCNPDSFYETQWCNDPIIFLSFFHAALHLPLLWGDWRQLQTQPTA